MEQMLLTIEQAGRALGIGRTKTWELVAQGHLPTVHIGTRITRIPTQSVRDYVARLEAEHAID